MKRRLLQAAGTVAIAAPVLFLAVDAFGRPGGGQSFRGGGSSYSGGSHGSYSGSGYHGSSSGGSGDMIGLLLWLAIGHPLFALVLVIAAIVVWTRIARNGLPAGFNWSSGPPVTGEDVPLPRDMRGPGGLPPRRAIELLQNEDPGFSLTLFEDFIAFLYAQAHELRGAHKLEQLSAYLSPPARTALTSISDGLTGVTDVIVGGLKLLGVRGLEEGAELVEVRVRFETNYTEERSDQANAFWAMEVWTFARKRGAVSRKKGEVELLRCPSCGAPLDGMNAGRCGYCHKQVDTGEFDWLVSGLSLLQRTTHLPPPGSSAGVGPLPPTVRDPDAEARLGEVLQGDPSLTWEAFQARLAAIFAELQVAWSSLDWNKARPYVTDSLFRSQTYWINRYRKRGLRNVTEHARIERVELASVSSDAVYDAVTVRVFARGLDYTIDEGSGKVVEGSKTTEQPYGEYWTLVRGHGVTGVPSVQKNCPSCGAPLKVTMAGDCEYCRAHVTSGEFDWVLSRIEQDEAYG